MIYGVLFSTLTLSRFPLYLVLSILVSLLTESLYQIVALDSQYSHISLGMPINNVFMILVTLKILFSIFTGV